MTRLYQTRAMGDFAQGQKVMEGKIIVLIELKVLGFK